MVEPSQYASTTKYIVKAKFDVQGVVEKPDVVGAVFGQTEGLFGPDLDLRELQKSGRIGRIEINLDSKHDKTTGSIVIPSSLDKVSTAIIAAAIESVDRIGPCEAKISLEKVEDVREEKRKAILTKAKDILRKWVVESSPSTEEVAAKQVVRALREHVPLNVSKPIERPQVASRPERTERPYQEKSYNERAYGPREQGYGPPVITVRAATPAEKPNLPPPVFDAAKDLRGTLEAVVFDEAGKELSKMPVSELAEKIPSLEYSHLVLFHGVAARTLHDIAAGKGIKYVIGDRVSDGAKKPANVSVLTLSDLSSFGPN